MVPVLHLVPDLDLWNQEQTLWFQPQWAESNCRQSFTLQVPAIRLTCSLHLYAGPGQECPGMTGSSLSGPAVQIPLGLETAGQDQWVLEVLVQDQ